MFLLLVIVAIVGLILFTPNQADSRFVYKAVKMCTTKNTVKSVKL